MALSESLLPEFDHETANTRKTLERAPEGRWDWKPHDKSMTVGGLTTHLANLLTWAVTTIEEDSFDLGPPGTKPPAMQALGSRAEALETFDKNRRAAREAIAGTSDEMLMASWSLKSGGQTLFSMPKIAVLRSFVMNHMIHHRAQLGVYLRLCDVPVPALYGPSADEQSF